MLAVAVAVTTAVVAVVVVPLLLVVVTVAETWPDASICRTAAQCTEVRTVLAKIPAGPKCEATRIART